MLYLDTSCVETYFFSFTLEVRGVGSSVTLYNVYRFVTYQGLREMRFYKTVVFQNVSKWLPILLCNKLGTSLSTCYKACASRTKRRQNSISC